MNDFMQRDWLIHNVCFKKTGSFKEIGNLENKARKIAYMCMENNNLRRKFMNFRIISLPSFQAVTSGVDKAGDFADDGIL